MTGTGTGSRDRAPTVVFFCKTSDRSIFDRVDFYTRDLAILRSLGYNVRIASTIRELGSADVYFVWWWTWAFAPVLLGRLRGIPVVITGVFDLWAYPARSWMHRLLHRIALSGATLNVFVSRLEYESVPAVLPTRRPRYAPIVLDTALLAPAEAPREDFILTIAGSGMDRGNSRRKCIPEIIQAIPAIQAAYPNARFVIVGKKGSDYAALHALASELGVLDAITFTGIVSESQKIDLLQRCAVYLQPTRFEGFGLALAEAMSCGAAAVTNAAGAVPEVAGDAVQYADDISAAAIARAVNVLLGDAARRAELGRQARDRIVSNFAIQRRSEGLAHLLDEALSPR